MSHPLVELRFGDDIEGVQAIRFWYHVPRVGDDIVLDELKGWVTKVTWHDEWVELVLTQMP